MLDTYLDTTLARLERIARDAPDLRPAQIDAVVELAIRVLAADLAHRADDPRPAAAARFAPLYTELRRIALALAPGDDALRAATRDDLAVFRIRLHLTGVT